MRTHPLLTWALCLVPLAAACGFVQEPGGRRIAVESDVVFGKGGEQELRLDVAMPGEGDGPFPAVVLLHGGGWVGGDRKQLSATLQAFAVRGYVAIAPDYRLAPRDRFPAQIEDCKAAVRWLRAHAADYRVNPERVGVLGFSAGGHLACLLGVTTAEDGLEGQGGSAEQSSRVQAVVSFFGPTDLAAEWGPVAEKTNLVPLLGGSRDEVPDAYRKASPVTYADRKGAPPFLFFHGTEDRVVKPAQSQRLAEKLQAAGGSARVVPVDGEGHGWGGPALRRSIETTLAFFDEHLKP